MQHLAVNSAIRRSVIVSAAFFSRAISRALTPVLPALRPQGGISGEVAMAPSYGIVCERKETRNQALPHFAHLGTCTVQQVRVVLRALALLQLAEHASAPEIARVIPLTPQAIRRLGHRYENARLEGSLYERQRPGASKVLDTKQKQRIIAKEDQASWTVRLVADEAVKRRLAPRVGRGTIRFLLLHHDLRRSGEKMW